MVRFEAAKPVPLLEADEEKVLKGVERTLAKDLCGPEHQPFSRSKSATSMA